MNRRIFIAAGLGCVAAALAKGETFKVAFEMTYTGSGTVDAAHKIYVAMWDSPDFMTEKSLLRPLAVKSIASRTGAVEFDGVKKNPVFLSMAYDPAGTWNGKTTTPPGSSLGLYMSEPGIPAPVQLETGKVTKVAATFDDSVKMK
jgi:hypothetical protein